MFDKFSFHIMTFVKYLLFDKKLAQNSGTKIKLEDVQTKLVISSPLLDDWIMVPNSGLSKNKLEI